MIAPPIAECAFMQMLSWRVKKCCEKKRKCGWSQTAARSHTVVDRACVAHQSTLQHTAMLAWTGGKRKRLADADLSAVPAPIRKTGHAPAAGARASLLQVRHALEHAQHSLVACKTNRLGVDAQTRLELEVCAQAHADHALPLIHRRGPSQTAAVATQHHRSPKRPPQGT